MSSSKFILLIFILTTLTVLGFWKAQAEADYLESIDLEEEWRIKQTIEAYFEGRYRAHSSLQLEEIEGLIDDSPQADAFRRSEMDKMEIEIYHAKVNFLRYIAYKFLLDFKEIRVDVANQTATVTLVEGHDVVFEISTPIVSSMRNLQHIIILRKENAGWKIVSDDYEDYVWRLIRAKSRTKDEILYSIDESRKLDSGLVTEQNIETICSLEPDESTYEYFSYGSIEYAHRWATAPRPYNSPPYYDFTSEGGDCTNFVSQAIHEGGRAAMVFGGVHGIGTNGWYFYNYDDRAAAWNWVERLYSFITGEIYIWDQGPEGCEVPYFDGQAGDIIQYDWENDGFWDHSVIIVTKNTGGYDYQYWVAGHTPDVDNYPYQTFNYGNLRFIHIERIDGSLVDLPIVLNSVITVKTVEMNNPYPEPGDDSHSQTLPYPAPIGFGSEVYVAYPAP